MSTKQNNAKNYLESLIKGPPSFGRMLCSLRTSDEISQTELAKKAKISKGLVCDIEKGRREATIELATKFARIMGYPPESFISILLEEQIRKANLNFKVTLEDAA